MISKIRSGLKTEYMGQEIHFFKETDSTNNRAREFARRGAKEGTLILAETQSAGRGRQKHRWFSPRGGVYLSLILKPPDKTLKKVPQLVLIGSIAATNSIKKLVIRKKKNIIDKVKLRIKSPNDILFNRKKIGGILLESNSCGEKINFVILGLGLNLNNNLDKFPPELKDKTTTLQEEFSRLSEGDGGLWSEIDYIGFIRLLLEELESWYKIFLKGEDRKIEEELLKFSNYLAKLSPRRLI